MVYTLKQQIDLLLNMIVKAKYSFGDLKLTAFICFL